MLSGVQVSIKDLARHIKRVPQYQKELRGVSIVVVTTINHDDVCVSTPCTSTWWTVV